MSGPYPDNGRDAYEDMAEYWQMTTQEHLTELYVRMAQRERAAEAANSRLTALEQILRTRGGESV